MSTAECTCAEQKPAASAADCPRPLRILVSYIMDAENAPCAYSNELHQLATTAGRAITNVADDVQVLFVNALNPGAAAGTLLQDADGVVIMGGADLDPHLYTDDPAEIAAVENPNPDADRFEIALILGGNKAGIPVLGVCRGAQAINVAFGGTLIADLGQDTLHRSSVTDWMDHPVALAKDSLAASIYGETEIPTRSSHHQAIKDVAPGLWVTGTAPDGVIEAVETTDESWLLGVQWHPEDAHADKNHMRALATAFIAEARAARTAR